MGKRNKYVGCWKETVSEKIDLPFNIESLKIVLECGKLPEKSGYTHQDIAHWCCRFYMAVSDSEDKEMDTAVDVASGVDAQWDLYLSNTYTLKELQIMDFASIRLPVEWFDDWLKRLT